MEKKKDTAKLITLSGIWPRAFAFLLDMVFAIALSCAVYFPGVLPFVTDRDAYLANQAILHQREIDSGLYLDYGGVPVDPLAYGEVKDTEDFAYTTITYEGEERPFSLLGALYDYWTEKAGGFGNVLVPAESFQTSILETESDSSPIAAASFDIEGNSWEIEIKEGFTDLAAYDFLYQVYDKAMGTLGNDEAMKKANDAMTDDSIFAICMAIPVIFGAMAVFFLIVPLCYPNGETFGKKIFGLVVLTDKGYAYPKAKLIWRFLAFFIAEGAGMVLTFGASLLISYTMTMFTKKHRSIHDYLAGSVVAKGSESLWFLDEVEEEEFNLRSQKAKREKELEKGGEENGEAPQEA